MTPGALWVRVDDFTPFWIAGHGPGMSINNSRVTMVMRRKRIDESERQKDRQTDVTSD